jgi:hypothetical protein
MSGRLVHSVTRDGDIRARYQGVERERINGWCGPEDGTFPTNLSGSAVYTRCVLKTPKAGTIAGDL